MRHSPEETLNLHSRAKPTSDMLKRCATSTAKLEGAQTATNTGTPAISAFWTNSKLARPLGGQGDRPEVSHHLETGANELVQSVVSAHVFSNIDKASTGVKERRCMQPASTIEHRLASSQQLRQTMN